MKRFRFRKLLCASAIGLTLGAVTLAAGPAEVLSGWWSNRPRLSESRLNPRNWGERSSGPQKPRRVHLNDLIPGRNSSTRTTESSSRPELYEDPFAIGEESSFQADPIATATIARKSAEQAAPSPRQRREAERAKLQQSRRSVVSAGVRPTTGPAGFLAQQETARRGDIRSSEVARLPDGLEDASQNRSSAPSNSGNQFSDGFDQEFQRLVRSVIAETEEAAAKPDEATGRELAGGRDSSRRPVSAPRIKSSSPSTLSDGNSVEDLIEHSRQDMANAMRLPPDVEDSPLITSMPGQSAISLTEATGRTQLQSPGERPMMVPSMRTPSGSGSVESSDLRNGWSGDSASSPRQMDAASQIHTSGAIRPRVSSNGAPSRSVPNNRRYERTSYNAGEGPLFGTVVEPQRAIAGRRDELNAAGNDREAEGVSSAPIIDWSLNADSNEPASAGAIPWGFASVLITAVTTLLAIGLLRKRQVVTVVTSGTEATGETA